MRPKRMWTPALALLAAAWMLAGCIEAEKFTLRYEVDRNLSGKVLFTARGIHSSKRDPEGRKKEFLRFLRSGYRERGDEMAREMGLTAPVVELFNTAASKTDGRVSGKFQNLVTAMGVLTGKGNFQIQKTGDRLSVELYKDRSGGNDTSMTVQVRFQGKVVAHNAHRYDEKSRLMEWDLKGLGPRGMFFVLER